MSKVNSTPVAKAIPFDKTGTSFTSDDAEAAIIEAKNIATSLPRFTVVTTFNGTVSNGDWLGYSNLIPGDVVPILIPVKCTLKEVTFFNNNTTTGRLDLYYNGTSTGDIFNNLQLTSSPSGFKTTFTQLFNPGDTLRGRWVDQGTNPNDAVIVYFFQVAE